MNTPRDTVPAPPPPPPGPVGAPSSRRRWWGPWPWWVYSLVLAGLVASVLAAFSLRVGYYEFRPGQAWPTADAVVVGDDVPVYVPTADIAYTTVTLKRSTVVSYVLARLDDDVEIVEERVVLGGRTPSENRQLNLALMDTSKLDAVRSALVALGYEVPIAIDGFVVVTVGPDTAADGVLTRGDVVVAVEGESLDDPEDLRGVMDGRAPGERIRLSVLSPTDAEPREVRLTLGPDPEDADRGIIGVMLQVRNPEYRFPFEVDIDSGDVGGPSAGLAFSLTILDLLTPGELTGGRQVAVTGTIDGAGNVGDVGGVRQKVAAAIDAGFEVFLVPSAEVEVAKARAGDALEVHGVDTLGDALAVLSGLGGSGIGTGVAAG